MYYKFTTFLKMKKILSCSEAGLFSVLKYIYIYIYIYITSSVRPIRVDLISVVD